MDKLDQVSLYSDPSGLDSLRQGAQANDEKAMRKAAEHFESIFTRMMLKSMRQAEDVLADKDSPFNSETTKFYRGMRDDQMAIEMSSSGALGFADLIVEQMMPQKGNYMPSGVMRSNADLTGAMRQHQSVQGSANVAAENNNQDISASTPIEKTKQDISFNDKQDFVDKLMPIAEKIAAKIGLPPAAMVAQAALETGWGQKMIQNFDGSNALNFFGIKADQRWQGDKATVNTLEFREGVARKEQAQFRSYNSVEQGLNDYVNFVSGSDRYKDAVKHADQPDKYFSNLQQAGYATDPNYSQKILSILKDTVFDKFENVLKF
ncbi:flagellar assembly peptidoglycan hydrolase FlgJ [Catenovulum maritimum]|uniref:Peptidoglycan hydrolase FlgJ n=1 Tax=Catenovulum maritimum TaxID=1513271 RepID=A0A0J8JNX3_9ALTE|nr:flagellar assembly peptidoglycan hydrolase FlgJ [Catenovulum maritimum]KMT66336.1 hypothetical protein XM47_03615 [Catenovulum maritimum]